MDTPFATLVLLTVIASVSGFTILVAAVDAGPAAITGAVTGLAAPQTTQACPELDASMLDLNRDGVVDYYDLSDVLQGRVHCTDECDWNHDGLLTRDDARALYSEITQLYDYDGDGVLTRKDARILAELIERDECGPEPFTHLFDITGDGRRDEADLVAFTGLIYNHDFPVIPGVTTGVDA